MLALADLGVAAGLGEVAAARGALGVLGANVALMVVGAVGTLVVQRTRAARAGRSLLVVRPLVFSRRRCGPSRYACWR